MRLVSSVVGLMVIGALATSCRSSDVAPGAGPAPAKPAATSAASTAAASAARPVATIVFVGQKEACDCTRNRIDGTWQALQKALEGRSDIEVKRLERDVDEAEADRFDDMKSLMVAPGVYFLDREGKLIQMLQGELTETQLQAVLDSGAAATSTAAPAS